MKKKEIAYHYAEKPYYTDKKSYCGAVRSGSYSRLTDSHKVANCVKCLGVLVKNKDSNVKYYQRSLKQQLKNMESYKKTVTSYEKMVTKYNKEKTEVQEFIDKLKGVGKKAISTLLGFKGMTKVSDENVVDAIYDKDPVVDAAAVSTVGPTT